ncbi:MAG: shikimate dehydrogenase, partial [Sphingomonadales bacterium]
CLIGSGGAAMAAMAAFRLLGIDRVLLNVRDRAKGRALLDRAGLDGRVGVVDDCANIRGAQLIVNATSLGMKGQPPMPPSLLSCIESIEDDRTIVFDMVYVPLETGLLAAARQRGLRTVDGLKMLVGQAATAFEAFFGLPAPRAHDAELRTLLTS